MALNLLASFLRLVRCPVQNALNIPDLPDVTVDAGKHPRRVMDAFARNFGEGPELDLLHIMGLFDRPADGGCIAALREPTVPGLTETLSALDEIAWRDLLEKLRDLGLIAKPSHHTPDELDAHPLVREHFGAGLRARREEAWKAGHERLYEHLKSVPEEYQPDTLAEMAPLFQAVHHGCQAGRQQETLDDVYYGRILRQGEAYLTKKIGAIGTNLGLVASFFDPPFAQASADLTEPARAYLLNYAAFLLHALGQLGKAVAPMRAAIKNHNEQENWREAARSAYNLSQLQLALGDVVDAITAGETAVDHADRSGDEAQRIGSRATLAHAKHQAGAFEAATTLFREGEAMQAERQPAYPKLYSNDGHYYCDLLLTLGQVEAVRTRVVQTLEWAVLSEQGSLLAIALDHLSLGRAALLQGDRDEARTRLDEAVDGLREAGAIDYVASGLLARAAFFREAKEYALSRRDLDEVMRIATRCGMRLFECDAHLEFAHLALAEDNPDAARPHLESAASLVSACGYHRRDPEIADLKKKLGV